jgi:valyl-tRNA synthetase
VRWLREKFSSVLIEAEQHFQTFRLSEALLTLYSFIWDDFCAWYLEMIKPTYGAPIDEATLQSTLDLYEDLMIALHPFMPFVTEEIWHRLRDRQTGDDCMVQRYPQPAASDAAFVARMEMAKEVISKIRDLRNQNKLKPKEELTVLVQDSPIVRALLAESGVQEMLLKLGFLERLDFATAEPENSKSFIVGTDQYYVILKQEIDVVAERERLQKELDYQRGFVRSIEGKLSNEKFVSGAPAAVVDAERKKLADGVERMRILEEGIAKLG